MSDALTPSNHKVPFVFDMKARLVAYQRPLNVGATKRYIRQTETGYEQSDSPLGPFEPVG